MRVSLLLILLLSSAAAHQLGFDAERSGEIPATADYFDITFSGQLYPDNYWSDQILPFRFAPTTQGAVGVTHNQGGDACFLVRLDARELQEAEPIVMPNCRAGWFQGYQASSNRLFLCDVGGTEDASLQARNATTGELDWEINITDLENIALDYDQHWTCSGSALQGDTLIVPFISTRTGAEFVDHRIVSVDVRAGTINWESLIPTSAITGFDINWPTIQGSGSNFLPLSATITSSGIVVPGLSICPVPSDCDELSGNPEPFKAVVGWLTSTGEPRGYRMSTGNPDLESVQVGANYNTAGSLWASGRDNVAHMVLGDRLVALDPSKPSPLFSIGLPQLEGVPREIVGLYGPVQRQDVTIIPMISNIIAMDPTQGTVKWTNPGVGTSHRVGPLHDDGRLIHALFGNPTDSDTIGAAFMDSFRYVTVEAGTGTTRQILPVDVTSYNANDDSITVGDDAIGGKQALATWTTMPQVLPFGEGLLVIDATGKAAVLEEAEVKPLTFADAYPALGAEVELVVPGLDGEDAFVAWGDRSEEEAAAGRTIRHTYEASGRHMVSVTVKTGGVTQTYVGVVDVGGTPPKKLNFMQAAFSPDNLDMTWGIIGVGGALIGALWGALVRTKRRNSIQRELEKLQEIRTLSVDNPMQAVEALAAFRGRIDHALQTGRMDDGRYRLLTTRVAAIASRLRERMIAGPLAKAGPTLRGMIDAALLDGVVDRSELHLLEQVIAQESKLSTTDRNHIRQFLSAWSA